MVSENFNNNIFILPINGYVVDRNFLEFFLINIPVLTIPISLAQQIHNPNNARHVVLVTDASNINIPFRQVSRDFYIYRNISIQFAPEFVISGWASSLLNLVESFDLDSATNTLTANLVMYNERTTGEVFSFNVTTEGGQTHRKSISIGN